MLLLRSLVTRLFTPSTPTCSNVAQVVVTMTCILAVTAYPSVERQPLWLCRLEESFILFPPSNIRIRYVKPYHCALTTNFNQ